MIKITYKLYELIYTVGATFVLERQKEIVYVFLILVYLMRMQMLNICVI